MMLFLLTSCKEEPKEKPGPAYPAVCDAGDAAWVSRAIPVMWGRAPHGAAEIEMWVAAVETAGRGKVVEAMARDQAYRDHYQDVLADMLGVARSGDRNAAACFSGPRLSEHDGALAAFLAGHAPTESFGEDFNMADVIESALVADDISVVWRANLFAKMATPLTGANVGPLKLEENQRTSFGETFFKRYLHRDLTCLPCHNSAFSVTGSSDPKQDRTWEIPGRFEEALLGSNSGIDAELAYGMFRTSDLTRGTALPWGMVSCGTFALPSELSEDVLGGEGFFIDEHGESGSIWSLEAYLHTGVDALRDRGLGEDISGEEAFAYLVAQVIADSIWEHTAGTPLTLAHDFPRNRAQRDRLAALTNELVMSGFSLSGLLSGVLTDEYFNAGLPETCGSDAYGLEPVYDPFTDTEPDVNKRGNGPGDQVHRHPGRTLLRAVHDAAGWPQPARFPAFGDPILDLQGAMGVFLRESQPGFNGTDFQGLLAFEDAYGACEAPQASAGVGDGCEETPAVAGCGNCRCEECVCSLDPYCCEVQWDAVCVSSCNDDCEGCGYESSEADRGDTIARLLKAARDNGATAEELVLALKDRLVHRGVLEDRERELVEALMQLDLSDDANDVADADLRALCGALLMSPDFFLAAEPQPPGPRPTLELDVAKDCDRLEFLMNLINEPIRCAVEVSR
ncbi:MAG: hypothetical protein AAFV53_31505 [Myxococcota bacterium]